MLHKLRVLPDPVLLSPTAPFTAVELSYSFDTGSLAEMMHKKMLEYDGVGLAGPQIGIGRSVFVYNDRKGNSGTVFNPLLHCLEEVYPFTETLPEGCLSIPGEFHPTSRHRKVRLRGYNVQGGTIEIEATGLLARIFQHETDHLKGLLYISYLPPKEQAIISMKDFTMSEGNKRGLGEKT